MRTAITTAPDEEETRELTTTCAGATEGNELLNYEGKLKGKKSKKKLGRMYENAG